ncbi:hypothetical protein T492DRAFT_256762 [Pavlovales sp. CCMP2436]|nr:hypothetical protein T492DRAFT_256762 [Pavlovales sp. CCMP2436]
MELTNVQCTLGAIARDEGVVERFETFVRKAQLLAVRAFDLLHLHLFKAAQDDDPKAFPSMDLNLFKAAARAVCRAEYTSPAAACNAHVDACAMEAVFDKYEQMDGMPTTGVEFGTLKAMRFAHYARCMDPRLVTGVVCAPELLDAFLCNLHPESDAALDIFLPSKERAAIALMNSSASYWRPLFKWATMRALAMRWSPLLLSLAMQIGIALACAPFARGPAGASATGPGGARRPRMPQMPPGVGAPLAEDGEAGVVAEEEDWPEDDPAYDQAPLHTEELVFAGSNGRPARAYLSVHKAEMATSNKGIILLADIFGWASPSTRAAADRLAASCEAFVIVPDVFRGQPWPEATPPSGPAYERWRDRFSLQVLFLVL